MKRSGLIAALIVAGPGLAFAQQPKHDDSDYSDAHERAVRTLNDSLKDVGPTYRGARPYFADDILGRYAELLARGASDEAKELIPQICDEWRKLPPNPVTGDFNFGPVPMSLDKMCDVKR